MKATLLTLRLLGILAGAWLIVSAVLGAIDLRHFFRSPWGALISGPMEPFFLFFPGSNLWLGLMFVLPWSRLRDRAVWSIAFGLLLLAVFFYLWRIYLPYTEVWRPEVLLDAGILQRLLAATAFVLVQVAVIIALRQVCPPAPKPPEPPEGSYGPLADERAGL